MKNSSITFGTILLVLGCFALSPAAQAGKGGPGGGGSQGGSIVGLWDVHYTSNYLGPWLETYDQWHSDGLEFEVANLAPGVVCQGSWKQMASNMVQLFHVGFVFNPDGSLQGPFKETQTDTVSPDGNSYDGTYDTKYYGTDGVTLLFEDTGTLHATRLPPQ
jgi:hypothetical protein